MEKTNDLPESSKRRRINQSSSSSPPPASSQSSNAAENPPPTNVIPISDSSSSSSSSSSYSYSVSSSDATSYPYYAFNNAEQLHARPPRDCSKIVNDELKRIQREKSDVYGASPAEDGDEFRWTAHVVGPAGSPYAGGLFFLNIWFPPGYGFDAPPRVSFLVKDFFHPNIGRDGDINIAMLDPQSWRIIWRVKEILEDIRDLLKTPRMEPERYVVRDDIAKMYKEDLPLFTACAKSWTEEHMRKQR